MERICPFLATSDDGRTVVDGFDRSHVCRADGGGEPVDRSQQVGYCLVTSHAGCERFTRAMERRGPVSWPAPSPDAAILQTRLVLPPAMGRRSLAAADLSPRSRRWLLGGAVASIGVAAVATGVAGSMGGLVGGSPATASPSVATETPVTLASPTPAATAQPTQASTPPTPAPTATATPLQTATAAPPQPQTYVVQPGDTLNGIAIRFGTTVQAIQAANGLGASDVILVGQTLVIP